LNSIDQPPGASDDAEKLTVAIEEVVETERA
jgi:hypothetical protein